ncbi:M23 family metallopeptidase [Corynebacterium crudilactis]|uniref:M23ase beta-sheet core domain-containing protein n=1 Tax=Corynebacterium crudilactis TaxID=1652495 RepID=A0A172QUF3_9CORY|nr:M23 family metallopeptidase [Corynebacterium crudilactis]ANE04296.1 hypothetical protein ccrud_08825 [Corynebacterium crudilactis]
MNIRCRWILGLSFFLTVLLTPSLAHAYVNPATGEDKAGIVLRGFDKPAQNWLPGHRGVDLPLEIGAHVLASNSGTVAFAGTVVGTPTMSIDHGDGIRTTYQPVHAHLNVGDPIEKGEVIGTLGHPTTSFPGLQWGAKIDEDYINPLSLLPRPTIRLKAIH